MEQAKRGSRGGSSLTPGEQGTPPCDDTAKLKLPGRMSIEHSWERWTVSISKSVLVFSITESTEGCYLCWVFYSDVYLRTMKSWAFCRRSDHHQARPEEAQTPESLWFANCSLYPLHRCTGFQRKGTSLSRSLNI